MQTETRQLKGLLLIGAASWKIWNCWNSQCRELCRIIAWPKITSNVSFAVAYNLRQTEVKCYNKTEPIRPSIRSNDQCEDSSWYLRFYCLRQRSAPRTRSCQTVNTSWWKRKERLRVIALTTEFVRHGLNTSPTMESF